MKTYTGTNLRDIYNGTSEDENIYGMGGDDVLNGGGGYDYIIGGSGADYMTGGSGLDMVSYINAKSGVFATIGGYGIGGDAQGDFIADDVEILQGSNFADMLAGSDGLDSLWGQGGDDRLFGGAGNDTLFGDGGNDILEGGANRDTLSGGTGIDTAQYVDSNTGVHIVFDDAKTVTIERSSGGTAEEDLIHDDVENVVGSNFDDTIYGHAGHNKLSGGKGTDLLVGGDGHDTLVGGSGADIMHGGTGDDQVAYHDSRAGVWVDLRGGYSTGGDAQGDYLGKDIEDFAGSQFADIVIGSNVVNEISLNAGDDRVFAGYGDDKVWGGDGRDSMAGERGDDQLYGDAGADFLFGGEGRDSLTGGDGNDFLEGGSGADTFRFSNLDFGDKDRIEDFSRAEGDKMRLSGIDANTNLFGDQDFTFIGTKAFTGVAGQLHYANNGHETTVTGDVNGDKVADFTITLTNAPGLIASDFLF